MFGKSGDNPKLPCAFAAVAGLTLMAAAFAADYDWEAKRAALGREDKLRILVDKVLSRSNDWVMTEKFVDEIGNAGFNVLVPRVGCDDMERVERVAGMARDRGLFYMAWMRGTLSTKAGTRLVWADGSVQDLYSPNADELWDWMTDLMLGHARLSASNPAIVGSFLDFENYAKGKQGNCYDLSYDAKILVEFGDAQGVDIPELEPAERRAWLKAQGLLRHFRDFQIESWRRRCRELRERIDAINPEFQLIVYPRGTLFLKEAIFPEWSTERAPLIFADHITYHRPDGKLPHDKALLQNKRNLEAGIRFVEQQGVPLIYTSGIDPIYDDADPEFCGRNAAMICDVCDGYWVFYEGPEYDEDHPDYFKWFKRANEAIVAGEFDFWKQPRQTPDPVMAAQRALIERFAGADLVPYSEMPMPDDAENSAFVVRTKNVDNPALFCVLLNEGETLEGRLEVRRLGRYESSCEFKLYDPQTGKVLEGTAAIDEPLDIEYEPEQPGVHVILLDTGRNAARLYVDNTHFCMAASTTVGLLGEQPRACFLPEPDASELTIAIETPSPSETARLTVVDPREQVVAEGDTTDNETFAVIAQIPESQSAEPWSLLLERAPEGGCEDISLTLEDGCLPFLATHPGRLLVPGSPGALKN